MSYSVVIVSERQGQSEITQSVRLVWRGANSENGVGLIYLIQGS